jgi:adenosylcobinamide-GDP ribazoletransferase
LIYSFALLITGFHHLDGLVDFGDGLMVHGDHQRRIDVMRDKRIGTGGLASLTMVSLVTFTSIASLPVPYFLPALIVSEISAKLGIITCATFSEPLNDGTGLFFIKSMNWKFLMISLALCLVLGFLALKVTGILGIASGLMAGALMALIARNKFKYTNGDILGASNEISRMISLLIMVILLTWGL